MGPAGAAAALCLFAVLNGPIIYSSEVKQYSDDVFFTLAVLTAVLVTVDRGFTRRWTIGLAVIGAVAMWFSHPVVFVLAGPGLTMIVQAVLTRDWGRLSRVLAVSATWAVSLGLVYLVNLRHIPRRDSVTYYLPLPVSPHDLVAIARSFLELLWGGLYLRLPRPLDYIAGAVGLLGAISLWRHSPLRVSLLITPAVVAAVASGVGLYPWGGRFILFLVRLCRFSSFWVSGQSRLAERRPLPWWLPPSSCA